ncbi:MAG: tetratricopeptide repeat protein [Rickettsiales bacterium]
MRSTPLRALRWAILFAALSACEPAAQSLDEVEPTNPAQDMDTSMLMAENMHKSGNVAGAVTIYRNLAAKQDGNVDAHIALASIYRKAGQAKDAIAVMREAEKRQPDNETVLAHLGYALIANKDYQGAVKTFDLLTAINHESLAGYNGKAVAYDNAGNHTAAQELYQKALAIEPGSHTIQNNLALSMILNNQPDTAISLLEPLSKKKGTPPTVRHNLALAYGVKGDKKRAREVNLMNMGPEQAAQNQKFYERYAKMLKKQKVEALSSHMHPSLEDFDDKGVEPVELIPAAGTPPTPPTAITELQTEPETEKTEEEQSFWGNNAKADYPGTSHRR